MKQHLKMPKFMAGALFDRMAQGKPELDFKTFTNYYTEKLNFRCLKTRFFHIISPNGKSVKPADFKPFLMTLLQVHPGLLFLESTPEFQERYADTVIIRIFWE